MLWRTPVLAGRQLPVVLDFPEGVRDVRPPDVLELADAVVRIPIYGKAESLNLATAAALCLYASARAQHA